MRDRLNVMKIFLRNAGTGQFFKTDDSWTSFWKHAFDFACNERAIRVAQELGLKQAELVVMGEDGQPLLVSPLHSEI